MEEGKTTKEEFMVYGKDALNKVKELIKAGNVRKIIIKNDVGENVLEIPLTIGIVGVALLPIYAAVAGVAVLLTKCTIVVEKREQ